MNLRKDAEGQRCLIRIPGVCVTQPTVLCHVRMVGISGMSMKAEDLLASYGCQACHDVVDGRSWSAYSDDERRLMLLEGVMRTQQQWIKRGIVKW